MMFKKLLVVMAVSLAMAPACYAQGDVNGWADTGDQGIQHDTGPTPGNLNNINENPDADKTRTGGDGDARVGGYGENNGIDIKPLDLPGQASNGGPDGGVGSGAATGMPILGTFVAPNNLALRNNGWRRLPETRLDSFVKESGYNDMIYGDEGTDGPPPYDDFLYINDGITSGGLTTGHPSDAPSAWGWPN
jgi:hypothetical protein